MTTQTVPAATDVLHETMPKRQLGLTGWSASVLTLGGVKWDTQIPEEQAIALIHRALELGINTFDTAHGYGNGQSELRLGKALAGRRESVWIETKCSDRSADGARRQVEKSLERLQTSKIDLLFVHGLDNDDDYKRVMGKDSVLKALEELRRAGHIRFIGVSGHHFKHNMLRIIAEYPFDAILCPIGLFNLAFDYSYFEEIIPAAREKGMAGLGMKVFGAGRVKHAQSREPYLRYSINQPIDTAVIGCDSIAQLEETVRIVKSHPPRLEEEEQKRLFPEIMELTQRWDSGEFNWVEHYRRQARNKDPE